MVERFSVCIAGIPFLPRYSRFHPVYTFPRTSVEVVEPSCAVSGRSARLASAVCVVQLHAEHNVTRNSYMYYGTARLNALCACPGEHINRMKTEISWSKMGYRQYGRKNAQPFSVPVPVYPIPFLVLFPFIPQKNENG